MTVHCSPDRDVPRSALMAGSGRLGHVTAPSRPPGRLAVALGLTLPAEDEDNTAMGFLDKFKGRSSEIRNKAADLVEQHGDKIDRGLSKAGGAASKATKGKYDDKIDTVAQRAREGVKKLGDDQPGGGTSARP